MTLQDDVVLAFTQEGNLRRIVYDLVKEEVQDFDLEVSSGEGWADIAAKTKTHRLLFEVKTHINVSPNGEIHEENVGGTIRQLKKYRNKSAADVLAAIIPSEDAGKWAQIYANAGFWVIGWSGIRVVRCPRCRTEHKVGLLAPNQCHGDFCGYAGPFEQISLEEPNFTLYDRYSPRRRDKDETKS